MVNNIKTNRDKLPLLELIFIICSALFYINFEIQEQYKLIVPFVFLGYMAYCFFKEPKLCRFLLKLILLTFILATLYMLLTETESINQYATLREFKRFYSKCSQYILIFFPLILFYRVCKHATLKQTILIIGIAILNALYFVYEALIIVEKNATVLHSMNAEILEEAEVDFVGFSYVYAFTFLILTCVVCFNAVNKKFAKCGFLFLMCYSLYFLFQAQFALSIATTFVSLLYLFIITTQKGPNQVFVVMGVVTIVFILPTILRFIISNSDTELLNERLWEIHNLIMGKGSNDDTDLNARLDLYGKCLTAFFKSPIWGNRTLSFNGHSTFLSVLADLGILGGWVVYTLFKDAFVFMRRMLGDKYIYFKPLICQVILMGLTNPIHSSPSNFIMLWFLCPLMIIIFTKEPKKIKNEVFKQN